MGAKYLVPCPCGEKHAVEAGQAGQELRCRCGATIEIPTMQGLARLERVRAEPTVRLAKTKWGIAHRLVLVGSLITILGLGMGAYVSFLRPSPLSLDDYGPHDVWVLWQQLREGPLGRFDWERRYEADRDRYRRWMIAAGVVTGIGLLTLLSSLMLPKPRSRARPSAKRTRPGRRGGRRKE